MNKIEHLLTGINLTDERLANNKLKVNLKALYEMSDMLCTKAILYEHALDEYEMGRLAEAELKEARATLRRQLKEVQRIAGETQ